MHQTTVRFGPDLWVALEAECARQGISAAPFVREAAPTRLAYAAGRRGAPDYEKALVTAGVDQPEHVVAASDPQGAQARPRAREKREERRWLQRP